jgi:hypothetical protein
MMCGLKLGAQGTLTFDAQQIDNSTGTVFIPVKWTDINFASIKYVQIGVSISGGFCIDQYETINTIHPDLSSAIVSFGPASITITRSSNTPFSINFFGYDPLFFIVLRTAPGSSYSLNFSSNSRITTPDNATLSITRGTAKSYDAPPGIQLSFEAQKHGGTSCMGVPNNRISDVTFLVEAYASCYPGFDPVNAFDIGNGLAIADVAPGYYYWITPSKSSSCDCGLSEYDINRLRHIILGTSNTQTLVEVWAGDYNDDAYVNTLDISGMNNCIAGNIVSKDWKFMSATAFAIALIQPPALNPIPISSGTSPIGGYISTNTFRSFVGIKPGDLDQNCSDCNSFRDGGAVESRSVMNDFDIYIPDFEVAFAGANLIREQLDLTVTTSRAVSAEFQIFDSAGRLLNTRHYDLSEGSQRLLLRDISLPPGAYWLAVQSPLGQRTVRFIGL